MNKRQRKKNRKKSIHSLISFMVRDDGLLRRIIRPVKVTTDM